MIAHSERSAVDRAAPADALLPVTSPRISAAPPRPGANADVISLVLHPVRLRGAVSFSLTASAPWVAEAPPAKELASHVLPGAGHVIAYYFVVAGRCWAGLTGGTAVALSAGDLVLFPQGDAHVVASAPERRGARELPHRMPLPHARLPVRLDYARSGSDETVQLVCGFIACDAHPFNPLLAALPRLLRLARAERRPHGLLEHLVSAALAESSAPRPGGDALLARMSELMFVEVVQDYLANAPLAERGWLAGLRDPIVGRALSALHARPAEAWTLDTLARAVGASRSTLAERFTQLVAMPPMQYLARWRMQLAASRIDDGATLAEVASEVGYGSEAALSRAFKKIVGVAPATWRAARTAA